MGLLRLIARSVVCARALLGQSAAPNKTTTTKTHCLIGQFLPLRLNFLGAIDAPEMIPELCDSIDAAEMILELCDWSTCRLARSVRKTATPNPSPIVTKGASDQWNLQRGVSARTTRRWLVGLQKEPTLGSKSACVSVRCDETTSSVTLDKTNVIVHETNSPDVRSCSGCPTLLLLLH